MSCNCNKPSNKLPINQPSPKPYTIGNVIKDTLSGTAEYAELELQEKRKQICVMCENYRKSINQCIRCGCIVHFKVQYLKSECPIGRW